MECFSEQLDKKISKMEEPEVRVKMRLEKTPTEVLWYQIHILLWPTVTVIRDSSGTQENSKHRTASVKLKFLF